MTRPAPEPTHACPGDCGAQVPRRMLACRTCWPLLPAHLRDAVTRTWRARRADMTNHARVMAHVRAVAAASAWYHERRKAATP